MKTNNEAGYAILDGTPFMVAEKNGGRVLHINGKVAELKANL